MVPNAVVQSQAKIPLGFSQVKSVKMINLSGTIITICTVLFQMLCITLKCMKRAQMFESGHKKEESQSNH